MDINLAFAGAPLDVLTSTEQHEWDVRDFNLAFTKARLGSDTVCLSVPVESEQLEWDIHHFVEHAVAAYRPQLPAAWRQSAGANVLFFLKPARNNEYTFHHIESRRLMKEVCLLAYFMSEDVTVHASTQ